jgi:tetratricopeptide (TPR) repeat protein
VRRAEARAREAIPPVIDREGASIELRLAIGRDGLGIELGRPATIGCVTLTELVVSLPGVRFPLDVSGGVSRFRHRRGELRRLAVEVNARAASLWIAPKLRGLLGTLAPDVWIALRRDGATIGIAGRDADSARVLAFDVTVDTAGEDVNVSITRARGTGLHAPATELAILAMRSALGKTATREGARFTLPRAITRLARGLLPDAGARAPVVAGVRWGSSAGHEDTWILHASQGVEASAPEAATRAREANALTRDGDDARATGDLDVARARDVAALERAPRHPELATRIAEIDQAAGGRAEAALATLAEADHDPGGVPSPLLGELLAEVGDTSAAVAAFARAGEGEPVPALAARSYERAAELVPDALDALVWLDRAVARAPAVARVRWSRVARRLAAGRIEDALADVEHLEAMASGARAKHAVWRRAGEAWRAAGMGASAATLFERALRYVPQDPEALAGLGASLLEEARPVAAVPSAVSRDARAARGVALLVRAVDLADASGKGDVSGTLRVDLARALAEVLGDRPAAIARVLQVPNGAPQSMEARALEGRWRAALGDVAGASLAFARLRDLAAARVEEASGAVTDVAVRSLLEAADFERSERGDPLAAQRHLAVALRLRPQAADVSSAYREVCAMSAPAPAAPPRVRVVQPEVVREREPEPLPDEPNRSAALLGELRFATEAPTSLDPATADAGIDEARAAARVEDLSRILQADPSRDDVVDELASLLIDLGRGLELLALLTARLEDASPERRVQLLPAQRDVLRRLELEARADDRNAEADLFRDTRLALDA